MSHFSAISLGTEQFKYDFLRALAFCSPHKYKTIVSHDKITFMIEASLALFRMTTIARLDTTHLKDTSLAKINCLAPTCVSVFVSFITP